MADRGRFTNKLNWDAEEYIPPPPSKLDQAFQHFKINTICEFIPSADDSMVSEEPLDDSNPHQFGSLGSRIGDFDFTPS